MLILKLLVVQAYSLTSLTSVSIITDFAIPSAVFLSICFLKVRYHGIHYSSIALVCLGVLLGFVNDYLLYRGSGAGKAPFLGDLCALLGGFCYALENVL